MPGPSLPSFPIPMVNGARFSFASMAIGVAGKKSIGFKAINYKNSLKPGKVRGTNAQVIGRTRGNYDAEGSLTLYKEDFGDLLAYLATLTGATSSLNPTGLPPGVMEVAFDITVGYSETPASPVQLDVLKACRITDMEQDASEGEDAIAMKLSLDILVIGWNGYFPINVPLI